MSKNEYSIHHHSIYAKKKTETQAVTFSMETLQCKSFATRRSVEKKVMIVQ